MWALWRSGTLCIQRVTEGIQRFTEGIQRFTEGIQRFTEGIQRYLEYPTEDLCGTLNTLQRTSVSSVAARYPTENFCDSPTTIPPFFCELCDSVGTLQRTSVSSVAPWIPYRDFLQALWHLEYPTENFCDSPPQYPHPSVSSVTGSVPTEIFCELCDSPSTLQKISVSSVTIQIPYRQYPYPTEHKVGKMYDVAVKSYSGSKTKCKWSVQLPGIDLTHDKKSHFCCNGVGSWSMAPTKVLNCSHGQALSFEHIRRVQLAEGRALRDFTPSGFLKKSSFFKKNFVLYLTIILLYWDFVWTLTSPQVC